MPGAVNVLALEEEKKYDLTTYYCPILFHCRVKRIQFMTDLLTQLDNIQESQSSAIPPSA
jgi:hypothetical protein